MSVCHYFELEFRPSSRSASYGRSHRVSKLGMPNQPTAPSSATNPGERLLALLKEFIEGNSSGNSTAAQTASSGAVEIDPVREQVGNPFPRPFAAPRSFGFWDTRQSTQGGVEEILARLVVEERRKNPGSYKGIYFAELEREHTFAVATASYLYDVASFLTALAATVTVPGQKSALASALESLNAVLEGAYEVHGRVHFAALGLNGAPGTEGLTEFLEDKELLDKTRFGVVSKRLRGEVAVHLQKRREAILQAERKLEASSFVTQRSKGKGKGKGKGPAKPVSKDGAGLSTSQ